MWEDGFIMKVYWLTTAFWIIEVTQDYELEVQFTVEGEFAMFEARMFMTTIMRVSNRIEDRHFASPASV